MNLSLSNFLIGAVWVIASQQAALLGRPVNEAVFAITAGVYTACGLIALRKP